MQIYLNSVLNHQVSTLQHPDGGHAPASIVPHASSSEQNLESMLGIVPHSIRGSLRNFEQFLPTTALFKNCTACSKEVGAMNGQLLSDKMNHAVRYGNKLTKSTVQLILSLSTKFWI